MKKWRNASTVFHSFIWNTWILDYVHIHKIPRVVIRCCSAPLSSSRRGHRRENKSNRGFPELFNMEVRGPKEEKKRPYIWAPPCRFSYMKLQSGQMLSTYHGCMLNSIQDEKKSESWKNRLAVAVTRKLISNEDE